MKKLLIAAGLLVGLSACAPKGPLPVYEFVCYTDGKVTEHHTQVAGAVFRTEARIWDLWYKDETPTWGVNRSYVPVPGESCGLE